VGAHLANRGGRRMRCLLMARPGREVDFVARAGQTLTAIEVKSGRARDTCSLSGRLCRRRIVQANAARGGDGIPLEEFLSRQFSTGSESEHALQCFRELVSRLRGDDSATTDQRAIHRRRGAPLGYLACVREYNTAFNDIIYARNLSHRLHVLRNSFGSFLCIGVSTIPGATR